MAFLILSKYVSFYRGYTWPVLLITFVTYNYIQGFTFWIKYIFSFLSHSLHIIVFMFKSSSAGILLNATWNE